MDAALLDTDMLNEVLKQKNANVVHHATNYLKQHGHFSMSSMTRYELLRGLKEKAATTQWLVLTRSAKTRLCYP